MASKALTAAAGIGKSVTRTAKTASRIARKGVTRIAADPGASASLMTGAASLGATAIKGYAGSKIMLGGKLDARTALGALLAGHGLYEVYQGKKGYGKHTLPLGVGMLASALSSPAESMGRRIASKGIVKGIFGEDDFGGDYREIEGFGGQFDYPSQQGGHQQYYGLEGEIGCPPQLAGGGDYQGQQGYHGQQGYDNVVYTPASAGW